MDEKRAESITAAADEAGGGKAIEAGDAVLLRKLALISLFKFQDNADIKKRAPFPLEYHADEDVYTFAGRVVLAQNEVYGVLCAEWDDMPSSTGMHRFFTYLKGRYVGISMSQVQKFLRSDPDHQTWFSRRKTAKAQATMPVRPWHTVSIDFGYIESGTFDQEGEKVNKKLRFPYLLVLVDDFTKKIRACLTTTRESGSHVAEMQTMIDDMPQKPRYIRSDNEFRSAAYSAFLKANGCKGVYSLPANPAGNARAETAVKTIKTLLHSYWQNDKYSIHRDLRKNLARVLNVYNNSQSTVTGYRPADLDDPECPKAVIATARKRMADLYQGKLVDERFNYVLRKGDKVRLDNAALHTNIRQSRKAGAYKSSHNASFSPQVYTVDQAREDNMVTVEEIPNRVFLRGQCLFVPPVAPEDRANFVTVWQGQRDSAGIPQGREDPFGYGERKRPAQGV